MRWAWRQLTSMRVALLLLMLLAVVAVPGSLLPQRPQDPVAVAAYLAENPTLGPWLDRLGFFDVYASAWFSAVYLLLFVSLVGCIVPRVRTHLRELRRPPTRIPRNLERLPVHERVLTPGSVGQAVAAARRAVHGRCRVVAEGSGYVVSAERGRLHETGNLAFHLALVGLLVSVAVGHLWHYRGQAVVVEGRGFANSVSDYDTFESGSAFDPTTLPPFTIGLQRFSATFDTQARPTDFAASVQVHLPDGAAQEATIRVNDPLEVGGAKVYLQGNGYAPDVLVRDAGGEVAFAGPVPFLPQDDRYTSRGVIKVPDVSSGDQIGIVGWLLPTAVLTEAGAASVHPDPGNPLLVLTVWRGDLGLDSGVPQNVYELDTTDMAQLREADGSPTTFFLALGETVTLPGDLSITWRDLPRFVALDLRHDPALAAVAAFALIALAALMVSLFTPRRRIWVRIRPGAQTVVETAGLAKTNDPGLAGEVHRVAVAVSTAAAVGSGDG